MVAHLSSMPVDPGFDPSALDLHGEPTYRVLAVTAGLPSRRAGAHNDARPGAEHAGEHDCLAVEDLRRRVAAWTHHSDTCPPDDTRMITALAGEAATIVRHLSAVFERGLA
jgi:hypothetical protein